MHSDNVSGRDVQNVDDKQWVEEFENWKSKTYALTVPLRVVALQGSVPPAWIKVSNNLDSLCVVCTTWISRSLTVHFKRVGFYSISRKEIKAKCAIPWNT